MSEISSKTLLVVDHGLFLPFAERMARDGFGRVLYHTPWTQGFAVLRDNVIGDGLDDVERCEDIWPEIDAGNVDCVAFPDIGDSGLQLHLAKSLPVWGSRAADRLEWDRLLFKEMQEKQKMPMPKYRVIQGIPSLRSYLKDNENKFIKWSKYRGDMETRKHINYALSEQWLDRFESEMSAVKNLVKFIVEDELKTDLEDGIDTLCVDGVLPDKVVHGVEIKDVGYAGSVQDSKDINPEMMSVIGNFLPFLKQKQYRNFLTTEVRIKDDTYYFTDITCRHPSPAGECELELISNLPEIVWAGAKGELVQPEFTAQFGVEVMIRHKGDEDRWRAIDVPDEVKQWVKLYRACNNGETYQIAPVSPQFSEIGAVVGIGDSFENAIKHLKENAEAIKNNPIEVDTDSIYYALKEIKTAKGEGVTFTDKPLPNPAVALTK